MAQQQQQAMQQQMYAQQMYTQQQNYLQQQLYMQQQQQQMQSLQQQQQQGNQTQQQQQQYLSVSQPRSQMVTSNSYHGSSSQTQMTSGSQSMENLMYAANFGEKADSSQQDPCVQSEFIQLKESSRKQNHKHISPQDVTDSDFHEEFQNLRGQHSKKGNSNNNVSETI